MTPFIRRLPRRAQRTASRLHGIRNPLPSPRHRPRRKRIGSGETRPYGLLRCGVRCLAVTLSLTACAASPAPKGPSERALFRDLERQVTVAAATGWTIDRLEIEHLIETALDSVCRVGELDRRELRRWLDDEISREGGPVDEAWRQRGKDLSKVDDLLRLTRVRALLARAAEASLDCPFWIEPETPFRGRQISARGWQLTFGGGGKATVTNQAGHSELSFGGAGRLLLGRIFDSGDGLYAGLEIGGSASFPKDAAGTRAGPVIGADVVAPLVYRHTLTNTYVEVEGGWLGHASEEHLTAIDQGVHVGVSFGGRALRARFLFPGAAFELAWERLFLAGDDSTAIKVGFRAAFDLDL